MSAHGSVAGAPIQHTHPPSETEGAGPFIRKILSVAIAIFVAGSLWLIISIFRESHERVKAEEAKSAVIATQQRTAAIQQMQQRVIQREPAVVYSTTPATITADYEFNIESDLPINVQYSGDKPVLYIPGKGFQQLPQPRSPGPKVFTDPDDPKNGHIGFRLYPVHRVQ